MQVEVNGDNIDLFGLDVLTGNTKAELLRHALEAKKNNHVLTCEVPDTIANVFDTHGAEVVDRDVAEHGMQNPIENSQVEGAATREQFHTCEFPTAGFPGETFKCRWCRREYYAEEAEGGLDIQWIIIGEIEN